MSNRTDRRPRWRVRTYAANVVPMCYGADVRPTLVSEATFRWLWLATLWARAHTGTMFFFVFWSEVTATKAGLVDARRAA